MKTIKNYIEFLKRYKSLNIIFALLSIRGPMSIMMVFFLLVMGLGLPINFAFYILIFTVPGFYSLYNIKHFKDILIENNNYSLLKLIILIAINFTLYSAISIISLIISSALFSNH